MVLSNELKNKVLDYVEKNYRSEAKKNINVMFHEDDFTVYIDGEYDVQIFYSDLGEEK